MEYSEQEIIKGCQNQNRIFQELLYKKYYSLFLKICARYAKDMPDAEQLLNDGFLRIFNNIKGFKAEGSFEGWMKRIVVNNCLDYLRSTYLKNSMKMHFNDKLLETVSSTTNNEGIEKMEFKRLVEMIQSLPVMTRTVFNLFVFEGYTHQQIGALMEISEGTSSWHVHHARSILQKKIKLTNSENRLYEHKRI